MGRVALSNIHDEVRGYRYEGPIDANELATLLVFVVPMAIERLLNSEAILAKFAAGLGSSDLPHRNPANRLARGLAGFDGDRSRHRRTSSQAHPAYLHTPCGSLIIMLVPQEYIGRALSVGSLVGLTDEAPDGSLYWRMNALKVSVGAVSRQPILGVGTNNYDWYFPRVRHDFGPARARAWHGCAQLLRGSRDGARDGRADRVPQPTLGCRHQLGPGATIAAIGWPKQGRRSGVRLRDRMPRISGGCAVPEFPRALFLDDADHRARHAGDRCGSPIAGSGWTPFAARLRAFRRLPALRHGREHRDLGLGSLPAVQAVVAGSGDHAHASPERQGSAASEGVGRGCSASTLEGGARGRRPGRDYRRRAVFGSERGRARVGLLDAPASPECIVAAEDADASRLLKTFPRARMLWVYAHYRRAAPANLARFGAKGCLNELARHVRQLEDGNDRRSSTHEIRALTERDIRPQRSALAAAALSWHIKTSEYFRLRLDREPRVILVAMM